MDLINIAVFIYGMACLIVPFLSGLYFWRDVNGVGRYAAYVFFSQAASIMVTLVFSFVSVDHGYNAMPPLQSAILRIIIFSVQAFSVAAFVHYLFDKLREERANRFEEQEAD